MWNSGINVRLRQFLRSTEGNIAIISGLLLPALVGFCGIAVETGYWYYRHRDIQAAADIAAFGATVVLRRGGDDAEVEAAATADAVTNGWRQAIGTIDVNTPPTSGTHQDNFSVEVLLTENQPRYFTRIFNSSPYIPISVRATGSFVDAGPACFLGLNESAADTIEFWGNATAHFTACNVVSNSLHDEGFTVGGSANVSMDCAQSAGGSDITASLTLTDTDKCPGNDVLENAEPTPDPYEDRPEPTIPSGACTPTPASKIFVGGTKYCGDTLTGNIQFTGSSPIIFSGAITIQGNSTVTGTGVTLFFTNGATIDLRGTVHTTLSAPLTGDYKGILMYGDDNNPWAENKFNGTAASTLTGALYFPTTKVTVTGNFSGVDGCMQLVADQINFTGSASFAVDCTAHGMEYITTPGTVALAE
jgi:hypothetical protein